MKSIWDSVELLDFPPMEMGNNELLVLNRIWNEINQIEKNEARKNGITKHKFKGECFTSFKRIVALDISIFETCMKSGLEKIASIIPIYPLFLVNNNISFDDYQTLDLNKYLKKNGYVLPIFGKIEPADLLTTTTRYSKKLVDLFRGSIESINISELENLDVNYSIDDLLNRYNLLKLVDNKLYYNVKLKWLGVEDNNQQFFNELYNGEIDDVTPFLKDNPLLEKIVHKSCFFYNDGKKIKFRLIRENIQHKLHQAFVKQFEKNLYSRGIVELFTKEGSNLLYEFHSMYRLFTLKDNFDTFPYKLLASIVDTDFDTIVLVDNGDIEDIYYTIQDYINKTDRSKKIVRVINYFDNPHIFPFDDLTNSNKVIIVSDIINTGKFIENLIKFIEHDYRSITIEKVYSFYITPNFNTLSIKQKYNSIKQIDYFIEKHLAEVNNELYKKHESRFAINDTLERQLSFWKLMESGFDIDDKLHKSKMFFKENMYSSYTDYSLHSLYSRNRSTIDNRLILKDYLAKYIFDNYDIDTIIIPNFDNDENIVHLSQAIFPQKNLLFWNEGTIELTSRKNNIMFFTISRTRCKTFYRFLNSHNSIDISKYHFVYFSIFSKKIITSNSDKNHFKSLIEEIIKCDYIEFYNSGIPVYTLTNSGIEDNNFINNLNELHNYIKV